MGVNIYDVEASKTTKISKIYDTVSGKTKKFKAAYAVENGLTKAIMKSIQEVMYTSSQTVTIPSGCKSIDLFLVGGGGGGAGGIDHTYQPPSGMVCNYIENSVSGAGGYTTTQLDIDTSSVSSIAITIGAGGAGGTGYVYTNYGSGISRSGSNPCGAGGTGGTTYVYLKNASNQNIQTYLARGGSGGSTGTEAIGDGSSAPYGSSMRCFPGASGGTGSLPSTSESQRVNSTGTSNMHYTHVASGMTPPSGGFGADTAVVSGYEAYNIIAGTSRIWSIDPVTGGQGQGSTTKAFGESGGTEYSLTERTVVANSGFGGLGSSRSGSVSGTSGASGVVIIRYHF